MASVLVRRATNHTEWSTSTRNLLVSVLALGDVPLCVLRKRARSDDRRIIATIVTSHKSRSQHSFVSQF